MNRIGILGGTFNPVHIGHLIIAQLVREKLNLDKVVFVPSNLPPHKKGANVLSSSDRHHMLRLAVRGNPYFGICDYEIKKQGKSYSIDTVRYLREQYPRGTKFYFIVGCDLLLTLHAWKCIDEILKIVTFVAVNRPGFKQKESKIKVKLISFPGLQASSSYVRQRLILGKTARYLVPDQILNYIKQNKLYQQ